MIENVADPKPLQLPLGVTRSFQNELVETIARVGIIERESFVKQHGKSGLVRQFHCVRQPVIARRAAIHLRPVKYVLGASLERRAVQQLDATVRIPDNEVCCHESVVQMRAWNRAKLLWGYLRRKSALNALPVEYIVETTAKCNLYCPMCPRETHKQPKADMTDEIFERLVRESGQTAEHMMLIGLGEPFMDRKIFERIEYCERHNISTLLSTNGTFFDEKTCARLLDTPLEHITLSFDGATKESFEYYRKGANFEKVRDNFLRFARMKHERGAKVQVVVQMVRMERNAGRSGRFRALLERRAGRGSGAHQGRRNQRAAAGGPARGGGLETSLPLFVARPDVREAEWRRISVLPELHAGWRPGGEHRRPRACPRSGIRTRCSACASCMFRGAPARSMCVRAVARPFLAERWWREVCCCMDARCESCCRWWSGWCISRSCRDRS